LNGRLEGRTAFVAGASSGIGKAVARLFVAEGAVVALVGRRVGLLAELADNLPGDAVAIGCDVRDPEEVRRAVDAAEARLGPIDAVVNSAGIADPCPLHELTPERWRTMIDVNLSGSFFVARETGVRMKQRGKPGTIVNVGSELSSMGAGLYVSYCASKAGVLGLTRSLAEALAPDVRVNAICPGPVDTPMLRSELERLGDPEELYAAEQQRPVLGRIASAEEVARAILYLSADASSFSTGGLIPLDGGTTVIG
jgi:NAD(P)-dependent dehydrogenase (short-subunit alcohol dehydrogenase family)